MHRAGKPGISLDTTLIDSLMRPQAFNHPVTRVDLLETHISWLILTDTIVYKIKKPITLDFLDFGDPEKRKFFCHEEIRLNKPWAPTLYLDVVTITLDDGQPRFSGDGEVIDYAVRMRRFRAEMRLDKQLEAGLLTIGDMRELATAIATRHSGAMAVPTGQRKRVIALTAEFMRDNFVALEGFVDSATLASLKEWTDRELRNRESLLARRFDDGFVRDCHGDLHLANLVRLANGIATFDCIEFNPDFRQIDVMCDIAFLVMDLVEKKRHDLAAHFLNRYLEATGDYGGVTVMSLFFVYRCLVRAKVAAIRSQARKDAAAREDDMEEVRSYCDMAMRQSAARVPALVIMHGLSGSGKTFVSGQLMAALPAIRVRSDIERKRIFNIEENASSESPVGQGIYTRDANDAVYERLYAIAKVALASGHNVILDAAFLLQAERAAALRVAHAFGCPAVIVDVTATEQVLRDRIRERERTKKDASEAGFEVLNHQLATMEKLTHVERSVSVMCDNSRSIDVHAVVDLIQAKRCN
jgi:aminoglycoside phosphotransferase family enzyme/predicted kinase